MVGTATFKGAFDDKRDSWHSKAMHELLVLVLQVFYFFFQYGYLDISLIEIVFCYALHFESVEFSLEIPDNHVLLFEQILDIFAVFISFSCRLVILAWSLF